VGDWPERGMVVDEFGRISVIAQSLKDAQRHRLKQLRPGADLVGQGSLPGGRLAWKPGRPRPWARREVVPLCAYRSLTPRASIGPGCWPALQGQSLWLEAARCTQQTPLRSLAS
jgi:hypothetical protein